VCLAFELATFAREQAFVGTPRLLLGDRFKRLPAAVLPRQDVDGARRRRRRRRLGGALGGRQFFGLARPQARRRLRFFGTPGFERRPEARVLVFEREPFALRR
jgi:hypothetical protein